MQDAHYGMPLAPHSCSSSIVIPPVPPIYMPGLKRESSLTCLSTSDKFESPTKFELTRPPLCPRSAAPELFTHPTAHSFCCVSPTDSEYPVSAPSLQLKKNFMRKFLSEIAEGY